MSTGACGGQKALGPWEIVTGGWELHGSWELNLSLLQVKQYP